MRCLLLALVGFTYCSCYAEEKEKTVEVPISKKALDQTGLLFWIFDLPADLEPDEYLDTEWRVGDEYHETNLNFLGIPPGQEVTVTLWTASITQYYRDTAHHEFTETVCRPEGMPYVITYTNARGNPASRTGVLKVPEGYEEPYGNLASGKYADAGWIMLRCNAAQDKKEDYYAFLEAIWSRTGDEAE